MYQRRGPDQSAVHMKAQTGVVHRQIEREPVESEAIRSIGFDAQTQTLEIEFTNGSVYRYYAVPEGVYIRFMQPHCSKGKFFNGFIFGKYEFVRVR